MIQPTGKLSTNYHWLIAASASIVLLGQGISFFTIGLYLEPVTNTHGLSKAQFGITMGLLSLFTAIGALIGPLVRERIGFKPTMIFGCALSAVAMFCLSQAGVLYQFHLAAMFIGIGAGLCSSIPASTLVTNWFVVHRGLVTAAVLSGTAVGGSLFNPLITYLIDGYSYHIALQVSATIIALTLLPIMIFIREKPGEMGLTAYGASIETGSGSEQPGRIVSGAMLADASKTLSFYLLILGCAGNIMCLGATLYYIPSLLADAGIVNLTIGTIMSVTFISVAVGKILMGMVTDRFGIHICISYGSLLFIIAMVLSNFVEHIWVAYLFAGAYGLSAAIGTVPPPLLTSIIFGDRDFATIFSIVSGISIFASAFATYGGGLMRDLMGSYSMLFSTAAIVNVIALVALALALQIKHTD